MLQGCRRHDFRDGREFHKPEPGGNLEEAAVQRGHFDAGTAVAVGHPVGHNIQYDIALVNDVVVLQVLKQRVGGSHRGAGEENRRAFDPVGAVALREDAREVDGGDEFLQRQREFELFADAVAPHFPGGHEVEERAADQNREPTAVDDFERVGCEEYRFDRPENRTNGHGRSHFPVPHPTRREVKEARRDQHGKGDGDPVRGGQRGAVLESQNQADAGQPERVVELGNIDLPGGLIAGMQHLHAREIAHLHGLGGERKRAGNEGLGGDDGRQGRQQDHGPKRPRRGEQKERVACGGRVAEHQGSLAQIVERERGQHEKIPGELDRDAPKMSHVGIERLPARYGQKNAADHDHGTGAMQPKIVDSHQRIEGGEDGGMMHDLVEAEPAQARKPQDHHFAENAANRFGAVPLNRKERDENDDGERHNHALKHRRDQPQPFHGGQDRNGRGDDAVAIQEGGAENPQRGHDRSGFAGFDGSALGESQGEQREDPPLPVVVGPEDDADVFDGDQEDQAPQDQRNDPKNILRLGPVLQALLESIKRARADIAKDHAQGDDCERKEFSGRWFLRHETNG